MTDLQSKFAFTLVAFGLFFGYALPKLNQANLEHDVVIKQVGEVYVSPNPEDPTSPSGWVTVDELQKYAEQKAAEQRARRLH